MTASAAVFMAQASESGCSAATQARRAPCTPARRDADAALAGAEERLVIDLSVACLQHCQTASTGFPAHEFSRSLLLLVTLFGGWVSPVYAWNATGHAEVVAVAWSALDQPTRDRVEQLLQSQKLISGTRNKSGEAAWIAASLWPDALRDRAENTSTSDKAPATLREWLRRASTGEQTRRWHFADRDIKQPFRIQKPHGLLEAALNAQIRLWVTRL